MGNEGEIQKSYFDVLGLCCSSEVVLIEKILKPLDGIQKVSVIVPSKTVVVLHDAQIISQLQIVRELNQARLEASVRAYGTDKAMNKWPSPFILVCGILLLISLFQRLCRPLRWLALAAAAIGLPQILLRSLAALRRYTLDINNLMLIAVGGSVALGDYSEAGFIVFLFSMAEWLESMASRKATTGMSLLMNLAPQKAILAETGQIVDAKDVKVDTIVAVKAGEVIPIDGIVVEGRSEVDEKSLTGESFPVAKQPQSLVWAGTLNMDGYISVKTTALAEHSAVAKMVRLVEEAQNNRSKTQRMIDSCAKYYTPAVVAIAAGVALLPIILRAHNQKYWLQFALVLLVSACPCALVLSTPVATFCALLKAARTGLLVKGGDVLEELAKTKVVAFDKTGTITRGEFSVMQLRPLSSEVTMDTLLSWISSLECKSNHPMASALVDYARFKSIEPKPENVDDFQIYPGEGVSGEINGKKIYIGNKRIAMRAGCTKVPDAEDMKEATTLGYVFLGAMPICIFALSDTCRTGAKEGIKELKSLGITTAMLTGDSTTAAMQAQKQLGNIIEEIHAELLPEDKVQIISDLKTKKGSTAMVGDGMNDAPALAMANVGISMGVSGSAVAMETSHITLMSNDIRKIPKAIRLARRTHHKIIVNIIFSLITKVAVLGLAIGGHPLLWAAVLADVGTCLLVILNSMTLLPSNKKKAKKCCQKSNLQGPTCSNKCSNGPCGSNSVNCHGCHQNETAEDKKPCCESSSGCKECPAELPAQWCLGKKTWNGSSRYEHLISINCEEDSHKDDESCLNHSCRQTKHTVSCQELHLHKSSADNEHLISPSSHEQHKEHSSCEGSSRRQSDHCHHESVRREDKSTHRHSDQEITCNSKTNATKSCCNTCVDQAMGEGHSRRQSDHRHQESVRREDKSAHGHSDQEITCNSKTNATKSCCNTCVDQAIGEGHSRRQSDHRHQESVRREDKSAHRHSDQEITCNSKTNATKSCCNTCVDQTMGEGHSRRQSDHCHHESVRREDKSTHRHSDQEITCNSKTNATKSCCNTCVDQAMGEGHSRRQSDHRHQESVRREDKSAHRHSDQEITCNSKTNATKSCCNTCVDQAMGEHSRRQSDHRHQESVRREDKSAHRHSDQEITCNSKTNATKSCCNTCVDQAMGEGHSRRQSDHRHQESVRREDKSAHMHSDQEITCNSKTNATKSCCNTCVDQTMGAEANLMDSTICSGSEKKNTDSFCESERGECYRKDGCSNL